MTIIGLDLAGVEKNPTGYCVLDGMNANTCLLYSNEEIIKKCIENNPKIIAIDAPLSLPAGRKSLEERTNVHLRDSDRALLKIGIKIFPPTLGPMRKLTVRGIFLRETFEAKGYRVIEAYPGGAQDVWRVPRKQKGIDQLRKGLEGIGVIGLNSLMSHHELDAATCALVGKLFLDGQTITYGSPEQGIVMPKSDNLNSI